MKRDDILTISKTVQRHDNDEESVSFDEAMNLTGFGKFNICLLIFCGSILLGMILETLGFSYVLPASQCDLELTIGQKGWVAAIPFICIILTSHTWGYLADTKGRKKVLIYAMSLGSFCSFLSSFSPNLITFSVLRFFAGLFIACPAAICYAYLGESSPAKYRDKMMILSNSTVTLGTGIVPLIGWIVLPLDFNVDIVFLNYRPWRLLVSMYAVPFVICTLLFFFFPESPKYLHAKGRNTEALEVLTKMYVINTGNDPKDYPVKKLKHECAEASDSKSTAKSLLRNIWDQTAPLFQPPFLKYSLLACFLQFVVFAVTNGFYIWFPTIIDKLLNDYKTNAGNSRSICNVLSFDRDNSSTTTELESKECVDSLNTETFSFTIILAVIITFVGVAVAFTMDKVGKRNILMLIFFVSATCGVAVNWVDHMMTAIALFSVYQFCGTCIGIINAYVVQIFPTNFRAMAVCITLMIGRSGSVFGTNLIGYLMEINCPLSFFFFSGLLYFSIIISFALPVTKKVKE